ncbi:MAG TPA: NINE protein [Ensifer sp.]|nr:NINE protein [Ensifer sp.]
MQKSGFKAFLLWAICIVGICGLHRFYVGRPITGIIWFLTLGLLGFGQLFDLFFLGSMVRQANILNGLANAGLNNNNVNTNTVAPVFNVHITAPVAAASVDPGQRI